jgi:hypothetical protein
MAQGASSPAKTATTPDERPTTSTGTALLTVEPLPSWPKLSLNPQHLAAPPEVTTQVLRLPAETETTPDDRPTTSTGTRLLLVELSPSCPCSLLPQHFTAPPSVRAHVWVYPAETERSAGELDALEVDLAIGEVRRRFTDPMPQADPREPLLELIEREEPQRVAHEHRHAGRRQPGVAQAPDQQREGREAEVRLGLAAAGGEEDQVHHVAIAVRGVDLGGDVHQQERELERAPRRHLALRLQGLPVALPG